MASLTPTRTDGSVSRAQSADPHPSIEGGSHLLQATLESIDLRNMWRAIWRWRTLVLWTTVALTALAIFIVFRLTPEYTASAQVLVGIQQVKIGQLEDLLTDLKNGNGGGGTDEQIATEIGVIRSRDLAEKTVDKLHLDNDPEFNPALQPPSLLSRLLAAQHIIPQSWVAALSPPPAPANAGTDMTKIIDNFEDALKVSNDGHSRIIDISFQSTNPITAAEVANTLADAYIVARLDAKFEATKRANTWLADRLNSLRDEVQMSEDRVEKFRAANGLLQAANPTAPGLPGTTLAMQQMAQVSADAITAHTKYLEAQSRLAQLQRSGVTRGGRATDAAISHDDILEVLQSPVIQALRAQEADAQRRAADLSAQYGDRYPKVINVRAEIAEIRAKIQTEVARIIDALKNEVATQQAREQGLNNMLAKMKADAAHGDIAEVQLHDLERQAQADRTLYENFLSQYKATQSQDSFQQPDADIISRAFVPLRPSFPQKPVLISLSLLASLVLGVLLALICENLDVAIRSMDQVRSQLKVYPLGMVPALGGVRRVAGSRPEHEVIDRPLSAYAEAIRGIHTNLMLADVDQRPRVVLVTSALPGEGKSTMAMSLAQMVARYGQRVIVIDGDLRRPAVHRLAGVAHKPGLIEWLINRNALEEVIYSTGAGGIDVIPAGDQPQLPPNLLSSDRFRQLLRGLMERYDMIILDSAPVLAVSDTRVLATLAEQTLFVVRWASTSHKVAASALRQLVESGARVAGAALMAVDVKAHAKDGFTDSVLYAGRLREYYR
ncbi:MAG TPA: polysaccharide biosynthesis tyrosine autokinase [Stellaceae bacterium]|nr:polysaccharide biosynthesis tyrosine autokinase [Stellaceae bacterium]